MYCTDTETLKARKAHCCGSCGQRINPGDEYKRWRCYDGSDASTCKMHPECLAMHQADAELEGGGPWEYTPHSYERPSAPDPR